MSFASPRRHRSSRTTTLHLPPNFWTRAWDTARRPDVLLRLAAFVFAALILWLITGAGTPPFAYRGGDVPKRKIIARVDFQPDEGSQLSILEYTTGAGRTQKPTRVAIDDVRIDKVKVPLRQRLDVDLKLQGSMQDNAAVVADLVYTWLESRLPETLTYDQGAS